jgi:3-mercaptopyruvate sulfurtransferase SseA
MVVAGAVVVGLGVLWLTNLAVTPVKVTWQQVVSEAQKGGYRLISTGELWDKYQKGSERILIVDTRQEWEYNSGHIQGAVNFPMEPTWWSRWRKEKALGTFLGPDKNRFIVFY